MRIPEELIARHIKTHSQRSEEDKAAVAVLEYFLASSQIFTNFSSEDKWPNTDGTFELVENPAITRRPSQNFIVQIKGTSCYNENNESIKYNLQNLAFPAYIAKEVTSDPGILFIVLNPKRKGKERVFWKYVSSKFLNEIDFYNNSTTITLSKSDEIFLNEGSIHSFVKELIKVKEHHSFVNKLEGLEYKESDVLRIIEERNKDICDSIDRLEIEDETRESISRKILQPLEDFCVATLLLNAISHGLETPRLIDAYEIALLYRRTKFLNEFLKSLKYLQRRIPKDGQNERLMLKYYDYLWDIRKLLKDKHEISILNNLEKFPTHMDTEDNEYYSMVATAINKTIHKSAAFNKSRYFIEKKTPFFIEGERYYELTLQLSGKYASKFNRIIAYSKENINTDYTIQIAYLKGYVQLWEKPSEIKVITDWKVSIDPAILNKFATILNKELKIKSNFGEYTSLMNFLKQTGMNLLDIVDLRDSKFKSIIEKIYTNKNTSYFKNILIDLHEQFNIHSRIYGKNIIRYILLRLKEEIIENIIRNPEEKKVFFNKNLQISPKCIPFENKPFLYNLHGSKLISLRFPEMF